MNLGEVFDIRFDQIVVRYRSPKGENGITATGFKSDSESLLNLGMPGAIMLLGKNGTGKSRFLRGLRIFGDKQNELLPEIILRYSVPSVEEHLDYLDARETLANSEEMLARMSTSDEPMFKKIKLNLPFHDLIIRTIVQSVLQASFHQNFGVDSNEELLDYFGFEKKEIDAFNHRMKNHLIEFGDFNPEQIDIHFEPRENLNFRDYFPEFFLAILSTSVIHKSSFDVGPESYFNCTEFLSNTEERFRLVAGIRELLEGTTHVELMCNGGDMYLSLVRQGSYVGPLLDLMHLFKRLRTVDRAEVFPFDLLRDEQLASTHFLKIDMDPNIWIWEPFEVLDLTFHKREESINGLRDLFKTFIEIDINYSVGPNYEVNVFGLDNLQSLLEMVNGYISEIDIGITRIELQKPDHYWKKFDGEVNWFGLNKTDHDFTPIIGWQDSNSKKWLPLESCSDGQLDVLRILINLCKFSRSAFDGSAKFLIIDEFDRHLHQVASQQLLNILDRYARKTNTFVVLSTHSIGSLTVHKHRQIFAREDIGGLHYLSTKRQDDPKLVAVELGVPELDVRKFVKLFVLVEGDHEEIIFEKLFASSSLETLDAEIINLNGLYGLTNFWRAYLQHEDANVLIVYDKFNSELESAWSGVQQKWKNARIIENLWANSEIERLQRQCHQRQREYRSEVGDTELNALAFLLKEVLMANEGQIRNIQRIHLHGVQAADIVDCLPINSFPNTRPFGSWKKLREENAHLNSNEFKNAFGINNSSVQRAVNDAFDSVHPELQRLWARILGIIEMPLDWPNG